MINRITLLLFIGLAFWSCEEEKTTPDYAHYNDIDNIGTWTLRSVCTYSDSTCTGECTDATEEYGPAGNFSMTFNEDMTGVIEYQSNAPDTFGWSGSNPYVLTGEGDGINAYISGGDLTFTALDSICIQYNLTK
jgi:hypothetical protein